MAVADEDADAEAPKSGAERLVFFSDAVLAIALTLLAIELPLPDQGTNAEMLRSASADWPQYLAFLISFTVIGAHWRLHHVVFHPVVRTTPLLIRLNQNWLLMAVVTPFLTRLLSEGDVNAVRFVPYAVAQTLQFLLLAAMIVVIRRSRLTRDTPDDERLGEMVVRPLSFAVGFALSIPVFLLAGSAAFVLWAVVPLLGRAVTLGVSRAHHSARTPRPPGGAGQEMS